MSRMLTKNKEAGFTLIELLVVIIIIGILAAIAVPVFLNQRKRANDGVLKADLRKVAMTVEEWAHEHNSWEELRAITGYQDSVTFLGANLPTPADPNSLWNTHAELKDVWVSNDVEISVNYRKTLTGYWNRQHEFGEFCLAGLHRKGNYAYPGGNAALYDQMLYYDVLYGGLATMDQLVKAVQDGQTISCNGWVGSYMQANGIN